MATKRTKKRAGSPRKGGAHRARKSRRPESRVGSEQEAQQSVSEPVEEGAPVREIIEIERDTIGQDTIGQKERDEDAGAEIELEEDWSEEPGASP